MTGYVYILKSDNGKHYVGSTIDLKKRLQRHNAGTGAKTTQDATWTLVCYRKFDTLDMARKE